MGVFYPKHLLTICASTVLCLVIKFLGELNGTYMSLYKVKEILLDRTSVHRHEKSLSSVVLNADFNTAATAMYKGITNTLHRISTKYKRPFNTSIILVCPRRGDYIRYYDIAREYMFQKGNTHNVLI